MALDIARMDTQDYDIGHYQPLLLAGGSITQIVDLVGGFFDRVDDTEVHRLIERSGVNA